MAVDFKSFAINSLGQTSEKIPSTKFIDTGSYTLNALLSADIFGGVPNNRVTAFGGASGTGKSYFTYSLIKSFIDSYDEDEGAGSILFDSEFALDETNIIKRGLDPDTIVLRYPESVEDFKTECAQILEKLEKIPAKQRQPIMFVLDSLGNLGSLKEIGDALEGKNVADMTRTKQIRSAFRILTLKLGKLGYPMIITNHTYANTSGYGPTEVHSGGGGLIYAASTIVTLSKAKDKTEDSLGDNVGNILTARTFKSRFSKESRAVKLKLDFTTGLDRYYGLHELAIEAGIWKKLPKHIEVSDGSKHYESAIYKKPEVYFTREVLEQINDYAKFKYGLGDEKREDSVVDEVDNIEEDFNETE